MEAAAMTAIVVVTAAVLPMEAAAMTAIVVVTAVA